MKKFNVLILDFASNNRKPYDVLPYFRKCWEEKCYLPEKEEICKTKSKELLKTWIQNRSMYKYWARCEYEFLIAPWPFGTKKMHEELVEFFKDAPDTLDYSKCIDLDNIIIKSMSKIDIHEQIMMNIDIVTDILYNEFLA